ncbi:hypothetical protein [Blastopirellula marina]|uniref:Uncharacterized protein n=1 Tax=Blastopirellula marina DSM 3645 TaxID=314230 RepID=A4A2C6_9BACT|nr:hypothetical protein [Blastopirellula marina]EAQ77092.1 hypothetical protein DSM3645_25699 [Blastopirellula marina DSM 3645]
MQRSVLVVGDASAAEFAAAITVLRQQADCRFSLSAIVSTEAESDSPAWIVVLQSRIGQFPATELAALRRRHPLARWIAIAGFWTAGELRTGKLIPGAELIPWQSAANRLEALFTSSGERSPLTASPEEAILRDLGEMEVLSGLAVIAADRQADFQFWADAVQSFGLSAVWRAGGEKVRASAIACVLYQPWDWGPKSVDDATQFLADHPSPSRILCIGLPRWEDQQLASQVGFTTILGQPFRLRDLQLAVSAGIAAGNTAS